jgi:hypothetical protein
MSLNLMMIMNPNTSKNHYIDGLTLFEESVLKVDPKLRQCARNQDCFDELMQIRESVLEYLKVLREEAN